MFNKQIRKQLLDYDCNIKLFDIIEKYKQTIEFKESFWKAFRVEVSIKKFDDNRNVKGRYTICIPLEEFLSYSLKQREEIYKMLNFSNTIQIEEFVNKIQNISYYNAYLGFEGDKGKIYFINNKGGICYESNNNIKFYISSLNKYIVYNTNNISYPYCVTVRLQDPKDKIIKWFSIGKDYLTTYERPTLILPESHNREDEQEYKFLYYWKYQYCSCYDCYKNNIEKAVVNELSEEDFKNLIINERKFLNKEIDKEYIQKKIDDMLKSFT